MNFITEAQVIENRERDRISFSHLAEDDALDLQEILTAYTDFLGPTFGGIRDLVKRRVLKELKKNNLDYSRWQVFDPNEAICKPFLKRHFPTLQDRFFEAMQLAPESSTTLIPSCPNEFYDLSIPKPINRRLHLKTRPDLRVYSCSGSENELFFSPIGFQYFNRRDNVYFPNASSRAYSKAILNVGVVNIDRPTVLIQDSFEGSNFSHFLFDWVTRLAHFLGSGIENPKHCVYLMGGIPGEFQRLIVSHVCKIYALSPDNFYFPDRPVILRFRSNFHLFSDQKESIAHPAHMAHEASLAILRRISDAIYTERADARRIYISRSDASVRRVANEEPLVKLLNRYGFQTVRLFDHALLEQISIIRGAVFVIAPHGMGLTHLAFHQGHPRIVEFHNPELGTDTYTFILRGLAFPYEAVFGEDIGSPTRDYNISLGTVADLLKALD